MSWLSSVPVIGGAIDAVLGRVSANKDKIAEAQARINEAEVAGAPASRLRLWRSFLGWVLALVLVWEVVGRPVVLTYFPATVLPPSMITEVRHLILAMLGLGL